VSKRYRIGRQIICGVEVVERTADCAIAIQEESVLNFVFTQRSSPQSRLHYRREIKFRIPPRYVVPSVDAPISFPFDLLFSLWLLFSPFQVGR
jgi:hypothetical protein